MPDSHTLSPKLRVRDVAERYGISERYVRHLVATRQIPFYKIGATPKAPLFFDQAELDQWYADQRVEAQ